MKYSIYGGAWNVKQMGPQSRMLSLLRCPDLAFHDREGF